MKVESGEKPKEVESEQDRDIFIPSPRFSSGKIT